MSTIDSFTGEHAFLSNFYAHTLIVGGAEFASVEHAFQAAKSLDPHDWEKIRLAANPSKAKLIGRSVVLRDDWEQIKLSVMSALLAAKFADPILAQRLAETGDAELIEGNNWGDRFWGVCDGRGENHLGKLLMEVRSTL